MLAVILKILSILGMLLLIVLCAVFFMLLLVLFIPIKYKFDATKSDTEIKADVRVRWLFGFLRGAYTYPEPGSIIVKVLWITVFDSGNQSEENEEAVEDGDTEDTIVQTQEETKDEKNIIEATDTTSETVESADAASIASEEADDLVEKSLSEKLLEKYEKIKYTIQKFCDRIKHIWDNITFYKKLLQDDQTKLLISHFSRRLGKILWHLRPRKLKADVIFGTGSPDTTGYAYGIYGMFSPQLGKNVCVTPDFTQQILNGSVYAAGHITIFTLVVNVLAVLMDKRLRILNRRLKAHSAKQEKAAAN